MKKWLLVLGMIVSIFAMTACSAKEVDITTGTPLLSAAEAEQYAMETIVAINTIVSEGLEYQYEGSAVITSALDNWKMAMEDMGALVEIGEINSTIHTKDAVIKVDVQGENRNAVVEMELNDTEGLAGLSVNVTYTFGEVMTKAALNTLIGMGTVFVVLVLIICIISCFKFIPVIQAKFSKNKNADVKEEVVDHTIAQIIEKEELTDDLELVAVIAAAIAASEGKTSTDGFRVRSIKRAQSNKWQKA